ncbi:hypothetical protein Hte_010453 [Hypoxylon texense]
MRIKSQSSSKGIALVAWRLIPPSRKQCSDTLDHGNAGWDSACFGGTTLRKTWGYSGDWGYLKGPNGSSRGVGTTGVRVWASDRGIRTELIRPGTASCQIETPDLRVRRTETDHECSFSAMTCIRIGE